MAASIAYDEPAAPPDRLASAHARMRCSALHAPRVPADNLSSLESNSPLPACVWQTSVKRAKRRQRWAAPTPLSSTSPPWWSSRGGTTCASLEEQPRRAHATHPVARSPHSPAMPLQPAHTPPPISPPISPDRLALAACTRVSSASARVTAANAQPIRRTFRFRIRLRRLFRHFPFSR